MGLLANSAFLWGLLGLSVPLLIHWLLNPTKREDVFSTIRFFSASVLRGARLRALDRPLLLLLRCLLLALILCAMANPVVVYRGTVGGGTSPTCVLVLDTSASMAASGKEGTCWEMACAKARALLHACRPGTRVSLVTTAPCVQSVVLLESADRALAAMNALRPVSQNGMLLPAITHAAGVLAQHGIDVADIHVISDYQRTSMGDAIGADLAGGVALTAHCAAQDVWSNASITAIERDVVPRPQLRMHIFNHSSAGTCTGELSVQLDGEELYRANRSLPAGSGDMVALDLPAELPPYAKVRVHYDVPDSLRADNTRYRVLTPVEPTRILCVETTTTQQLFRQRSYHLQTAFLAARSKGHYAVDVCTVAELLQRANDGNLRDHADLLCVPGLPDYSEALVTAITEYTVAGGVLALFLGREVVPVQFNRAWGEFLPADLNRVEDPEEQSAWHLREWDTESPFFAAVSTPGSGNLALPRFFRRFSFIPGFRGEVRARFDDTTPLLLTATRGDGEVLLFNTTLGPVWTDWQKRKTFVPVLCGVASLASPGSAALYDPSVLPAGSSVRWPDGSTHEVGERDAAREDLTGTDTGFYDCTAADGSVCAVWTRNVHPRESDLHSVDAQHALDSVPRARATHSARTPAAVRRVPLWPWVIVLAVLCAALELRYAGAIQRQR